MVCESCASGRDCPCASWACDCPCQRDPLVARVDAVCAAAVKVGAFPLSAGHDLGPLVRRVDELAESMDRLVALDRAGCPRCGTPLPPVDVGFDEDENAVVAVAECAVCGWERPQKTFAGPELREWVRRRKALVRQRKEAS